MTTRIAIRAAIALAFTVFIAVVLINARAPWPKNQMTDHAYSSAQLYSYVRNTREEVSHHRLHHWQVEHHDIWLPTPPPDLDWQFIRIHFDEEGHEIIDGPVAGREIHGR